MISDQLRKARSYIDWMRKRITLSLDGYYPDWENAPRIRASIGATTSQDGDVTCKPSIGIVGGPLLRPKIVRRVRQELDKANLPPAIQLALALKLSRTEADAFLKAAGFAFSSAILEDIIVCACISANVFEIDDVNALLAEYGSTPFAVQEGTDRCLQQGDTSLYNSKQTNCIFQQVV